MGHGLIISIREKSREKSPSGRIAKGRLFVAFRQLSASKHETSGPSIPTFARRSYLEDAKHIGHVYRRMLHDEITFLHKCRECMSRPKENKGNERFRIWLACM